MPNAANREAVLEKIRDVVENGAGGPNLEFDVCHKRTAAYLRALDRKGKRSKIGLVMVRFGDKKGEMVAHSFVADKKSGAPIWNGDPAKKKGSTYYLGKNFAGKIEYHPVMAPK